MLVVVGGGVCGDVLEPAGSKPPSKKHINSLNPDSPKKTTVSEPCSETVSIYFLHDNLFLDFFVWGLYRNNKDNNLLLLWWKKVYAYGVPTIMQFGLLGRKNKYKTTTIM